MHAGCACWVHMQRDTSVSAHTRVPLQLSCEYFQGVRGNISYLTGFLHLLRWGHSQGFNPCRDCSLASSLCPKYSLQPVQQGCFKKQTCPSFLAFYSPDEDRLSETQTGHFYFLPSLPNIQLHNILQMRKKSGCNRHFSVWGLATSMVLTTYFGIFFFKRKVGQNIAMLTKKIKKDSIHIR